MENYFEKPATGLESPETLIAKNIGNVASALKYSGDVKKYWWKDFKWIEKTS